MSNTTQEILSNIDFATEVKADRLDLFWKITLVFSVIILLMAIVLVTVYDLNPAVWLLSPLVLLLTSFITRISLKRENFETAAVIFTLGGVAAVGAAMFSTDSFAAQVFPFVFVLVIFIGGLLLRPRTTFLVMLLCIALTIGIPLMQHGDFSGIGAYQLAAILLMVISTALTAQVTGELYAVTEWALMNYQRQRRTNFDLFDSKLELKKTLDRSEALSEKLQETNIALEQARRAEEDAKNFRGQFLANMSHELRTPLNAIIGFSETMLKFPMMYNDIPLPDEYRKDMNQIYTSGRQLLHLINDILDLARVDAGKLEIYRQEVNIRPVIDAVITTANGLISGKPIEMHEDIPEDIATVWADETRLRQVLLNIYSNAAKFTNEGSISLKVIQTDDEVQFSIRDTGVGIREDQLEKIFEEFSQAEHTGRGGRDPRSGAGLGLTISRQLLTLMDGKIWVESVVGEGSTFHFTIPRYHKAKAETIEHRVIVARSVDTAEVPLTLSEEAESPFKRIPKPKEPLAQKGDLSIVTTLDTKTNTAKRIPQKSNIQEEDE